MTRPPAAQLQTQPSFTFCYYSMSFLNRLYEAAPVGEGESSLLSEQIQMLVSSRNILKDTPLQNDLAAIWVIPQPSQVNK